MLLLKLVLGVAGVGAGVGVPVVASKVVGLVPNTVAEMTGINQTNTWKSIQERIAERKTNSRVQEALKELINKECKLIQNPQGINNGYDELYACKGGANKTDFYYFGSQESFKNDSDSYLPKKVVKASYKEGQDQKIAQLVLTFEDNNSINWNIVSGSGWNRFNDVNLSEQCSIKTKELGGDDLGCTLKNTDGSSFYYSFSVF